jgi:integrase
MKYEYANKGLRTGSQERYDDIIEMFNEHLEQHEIKFSLPVVKEWLEHITNPNTYNVHLHALKSWLKAKYAKKSMAERLRLREFFESLHMKKVRKSVDENGYLPLSSVLTLAESAPNRIGCFIEALFQSGARISALLNIKLTDCTVDTAKGFVYIRIVDKCDIERKVNMTLTLYNRILDTFRGQKYLFETFEGKKYTREYVSREIHEVGKALKVRANCHILRHSLAMYLKYLGFSADEIARTMGHQDELTTLKYYFHGTISAEQQLGALK